MAYSSSFDLEATILRFSNIFGPGSLGKTSVVARMIRDALLKHEITIFGSGTQVRDFVYIDDLIEVLVWSITASHGTPIHVCSGIPTTISDIASMVSTAVTRYTGKKILTKTEQRLVGDAQTNYSSPQTLIGLKAPKIRPIDYDLVERTVNFFIENQSLLDCNV